MALVSLMQDTVALEGLAQDIVTLEGLVQDTVTLEGLTQDTVALVSLTQDTVTENLVRCYEMSSGWFESEEYECLVQAIVVVMTACFVKVFPLEEFVEAS